MKKFREVRVRYTHPAIPPMGIDVNEVYKVGHLLDVYKVDDLIIKEMFTPIDTTWDELNKLNNKTIRKNKAKEVVVDDLDESIDGAE